MSWIFGYKKPALDLPPANPDGAPPAGNTANDQQPLTGRESIYKFDSTALERAAKAAKELERSRQSFLSLSLSLSITTKSSFAEYANQAFDVVKMQEQTKQLEIQKQMKVRGVRNRTTIDDLSLSLRNIRNTKKRSDSNINSS